MWELDHKEGWASKNWCFQTVVLEKTLESPLDCKEIKSVSLKGNQSWMISPEGLMLKLKLQHFGHLMWRADWLFFFFNFILFLNLHNCIRFAKYQNESATGIHVLLIIKDPDVGKDWGQEEKRAVEDEMVGWHHWLNGHEFKQTPGDSEGQVRLVCCSPWGCKESDTT